MRLELALLGHLITVAVKEWGIGLPFNPVSITRRPAAGSGRNRRLTPVEQNRPLQAELAFFGELAPDGIRRPYPFENACFDGNSKRKLTTLSPVSRRYYLSDTETGADFQDMLLLPQQVLFIATLMFPVTAKNGSTNGLSRHRPTSLKLPSKWLSCLSE